MKLVLALLFCLPTWAQFMPFPGPGLPAGAPPAGIALVNSGNGLTAGGTTGATTAAFDSSASGIAGLHGFVAACVVFTQGTIVTVADNKGNTYVPRTGTTSNPVAQLWYAKDAAVGTGHTLTVGGSGTFGTIAPVTFSGVSTTSPFDKEAAGAANPTSTTIQPGSVTPSATGSVILTCLAVGSSGTTISVDDLGNAFTQDGISNYSAGVHWGIGLAHKLVGTVATNETWTMSPSGALAAGAAVFK